MSALKNTDKEKGTVIFMLKENLMRVEEDIQQACAKAGRERAEVTLIAVSKTKPVEMLQEIYAEGIRVFGENKVQELCDKMDVMPQDIKWHMIGHLQRNKVKYIVGRVALIHSVDTYRLAEEINIQAKKKNIIMPILVEVNIAEEATKFGTSAEDARLLVEEISQLENVAIKGLMTIAPNVADPEENRAYFRGIRQLSKEIEKAQMKNVSMEILSMGMTGDYRVAIEEGATMVRVGTGIFGERNYHTT